MCYCLTCCLARLNDARAMGVWQAIVDADQDYNASIVTAATGPAIRHRVSR